MRSRTAKRNQNVAFNRSESDEIAQVRKRDSVRSLLNQTQKYEYSEDHMYTRNVDISTQGQNLKRKLSFVDDDDDDDDYQEESQKKRCTSKNAVMARLNRERKKQYIVNLERENDYFKTENDKLEQKLKEQNDLVTKMRNEVIYLKSLLANNKGLCMILRNFTRNTGMPVTSSMFPAVATPAVVTPAVVERQPSVARSYEDGYMSGDSEVKSGEWLR